MQEKSDKMKEDQEILETEIKLAQSFFEVIELLKNYREKFENYEKELKKYEKCNDSQL